MTTTFNRKTDPSRIDNDWFKYALDEPVRVISFRGAQPVCKVVAAYNSDEHNHPAESHKRYVVVCGTGPKTSVIDVSEDELAPTLYYEDMS